jgi:hypothetical protein
VAQSDSGFLILDEAPLAGRADYQKLLANLLFALQRRPAALSLEVFQWPPTVKAPQLDQGDAAARETLAAYVQKRLHGDTRVLLLLGDTARHWVSAELCEQLVQPPLICAVSRISAWTCLREPAAKPQLWADLRSLVQPQ